MKGETYSDMASYSGSALFLDQLEIESGPVLILNEIYMIYAKFIILKAMDIVGVPLAWGRSHPPIGQPLFCLCVWCVYV